MIRGNFMKFDQVCAITKDSFLNYARDLSYLIKKGKRETSVEVEASTNIELGNIAKYLIEESKNYEFDEDLFIADENKREIYTSLLNKSLGEMTSKIKIDIHKNDLEKCEHSVQYSAKLTRLLMLELKQNKLLLNVESVSLINSHKKNTSKFEINLSLKLKTNGTLWAKVFVRHMLSRLNNTCLKVGGDIQGLYRYDSDTNDEKFHLRIRYNLLESSYYLPKENLPILNRSQSVEV